MCNRLVRIAGLMLGALACVIGNARADNEYSVSYSTSSSLAVGISFTAGGTETHGTASTYAIPFTVTPVSPSGSSFTAFCADLWHTESNNSDFYTSSQITSGFASAINTAAGSTVASDTGSTPATNMLNYLGYVFQSLKSTDTYYAEEVGAVQLAIWHVINPSSFQVTSWPNGTAGTELESYFKLITGWTSGTSYSGGLLGGGTSETIGTASINAYVSSDTYSGGTMYVVNQSDCQAQNLIAWGGTVTVETAGTPEPSSLAIAGIGALAFVGYGLRRRKAMRSGRPNALPEASDSAAGDASAEVTA